MCKLYYRIYIKIIINDFYHYSHRLLATGLLLNLCAIVFRHFTSASHRVPLPKERNLAIFKGHTRLLILNIMSLIDV